MAPQLAFAAFERRRRDPLRPGILLPGLALAASLSAIAGIASGLPWLLPILNAGPAWFVMVSLVARGRRVEAVAWMLWWALCLGAATTVLCMADPWGTASASIVNGPRYLGDMRPWIATGAGCESSPACFVPQHLLHAGIFAAVCLATASAAGLVMGAILMNYMAYYVGSIAASSASPAAVAVLGWAPWSVIRIVAFVIVGAALAEPLVGRVTRSPSPPGRGRWLMAAAIGLVADMVLKAILAPHWASLLRRLIHG